MKDSRLAFLRGANAAPAPRPYSQEHVCSTACACQCPDCGARAWYYAGRHVCGRAACGASW